MLLEKLEIQTLLNVAIKQMSERLGDARYIYQVNLCTIVSFYCVTLIVLLCKDKDHCCVLYDVTRDLLFARYIVHQPNVYPSTEPSS